MLRRVLTLAACVATLGASIPAVAQEVSAGVEVATDRSTWHFDNPSSHDAAGLVPHYFEQHYVLDNVWFTARASYRAGVDWTTRVAVTPVRQALATDYDTFFDSGNVVTVIGTTGDARMHSVKFEQGLELGRLGAVRLSGGYRLRVDLADFLAGDKSETRNGALVNRSLITTREYTNGQTHELYVRGERQWDSGTRWQWSAAADAAPAVHRLAIQLPDKYPGQTIVYRTAGIATTGRVGLTRTGAWPLTLSATGVRSWNYRTTQWVRRSGLGVGLTLGHAW